MFKYSSALGLAGAVAAKSAIGAGGIGLGGIGGGLGGIGGGIGGIGGGIGGHGGQYASSYGPSYGYGNGPASIQAAPINYYPSQQTYVPPPQVQPVQTVQQIQPVPVQQIQAAPIQQIQAAPIQTVYGQPSYGPPSYGGPSYGGGASYGGASYGGSSYGGPLSAAIAWKSGIVNGITNSLSNGIIGLRPPVAAAPSYSYAPAPAQIVSAPVYSSQILSAPGTDIPVAPLAPAAHVESVAQVGPVPNPNKPVYVVCDNQ